MPPSKWDRFWRVEMFGGLRLSRETTEITRFQTHKSAALLAYLALHNHHATPREVLAELFWPETEPEAQRNSLRVALNSLRRQLEPPELASGTMLLADRATVRLNPEGFSTDVSEFESTLKSEERLARSNAPRQERISALQSAVNLYRGSLLSGWYEDWADLEQNRLSEMYANTMRRLATLLLETKEHEQAIEVARRSIAVDPLREESHRLLIRIYAAIGRQSDAVRQYRELETVLQDQLGAKPSAATRELVREFPLTTVPKPVSTKDSLSSSSVLEPEISEEVVPPPTTEPVLNRRASDRLGGYVPRPLSPIYGRDQEIKAVHDVLCPSITPPARLVTLTGPGGIGKTRLALEVAGQLRTPFAGRVWYVALAGVTEESALAPAIATTLRLPILPDTLPVDQIRDALAGAPTLLVLDNMEQMVGAGGANFVYDLLMDLPELSCLVTSRMQLDIDGEIEYPILPLPTPVVAEEAKRLNGVFDGGNLTPEAMMTFPSTRLFMDRARAIRPDFTVTARNVSAIAELMEYLEGIPLAVELAAAWVQVMTPAQMLERLRRENAADDDTNTDAPDGRFTLLVTERRSLPMRHRSLRMVLEESRQLLSPSVQRYLGLISVFRGSLDLASAEAVCGTIASSDDINGKPETSVAEALRILRQHSFLREVDSAQESEIPRFQLLETVREFAASTLTVSERQRAIQAHARYFAGRAEAYRDACRQQGKGVSRVGHEMYTDHAVEADRENLYAAICGALIIDGEWETAIRLAAAVWPFWYAWGMAGVGASTLRKILAAQTPSADVSLLLLAEVHFGLGRLASGIGAPDEAQASFDSCLALCHRKTVAYPSTEESQRLVCLAISAALCRMLALRDSGTVAMDGLREACSVLVTCLEAGVVAGVALNWEVAWANGELARQYLAAEQPQATLDLVRKTKPLLVNAGDREGEIELLLLEADALDTLGRSDEAHLIRKQVSSYLHRSGFEQSEIAASLLHLGYVALRQGDTIAGRVLLKDAEETYTVAGNPRGATIARQIRDSVITI